MSRARDYGVAQARRGAGRNGFPTRPSTASDVAATAARMSSTLTAGVFEAYEVAE